MKKPVVYTMGMKATLFGVSDVSKIKEVDSEIIGGRRAYSAARHDHKVLYEDKKNNFYGFPVVHYNNEQYMGLLSIILSRAALSLPGI